MQTFIPYTCFLNAAKVLDQKRLGKQRLEAKQILDLVEGRADNNWKHHPAVRMWEGFGHLLKYYYRVVLFEWERRGYVNNMTWPDVEHGPFPDWLYDERLVLSHRCNLMRKDPEYYGQFRWKNIDPKAPYWWPVPLKTPAKQKEMIEYWGE